ncbi:CHAT domain-containing protein [Mesorhizobium sp. M0146]|uniref:CHAT domain-containing protein n=1 Tax=unclassified Mesorhizobium TaxID=325217 RepID=UPI0033380F4E
MEGLLIKFFAARSDEQKCRLITLCPILLNDTSVDHISTFLKDELKDDTDILRRFQEGLDFLRRGQSQGIAALCPAISLAEWEGPLPRPHRTTVEIPAGACTIGSDRGDRERAEAPAVSSFIDAFRIDKYPVTNREYAEFVAQTGYPISEIQSSFQISGEGQNDDALAEMGSLLSDLAKRGFRPGLGTTKPNEPVVEISWFDAVEFCRWVRMRLPTAHEWEKAARGPNAFDWSYGNSPEISKCNVREANLEHTTPVTDYERWPSPYGCCDMSGNAMEWTATSVEGSDLLDDNYVIKGGCWSFSIGEAQTWKLHTNPPTDLWNALGFRCCVSQTSESGAASEERARIKHFGDSFVELVAKATAVDGSKFDYEDFANQIDGVPPPQKKAIVFDLVDYIDAQLSGRFRSRQIIVVLDGLARLAGVLADRLGDDECAVRSTCAKARILMANHDSVGSIEGVGPIDMLEGCVEQCRSRPLAEGVLARVLLALAEAKSHRNMSVRGQQIDLEGSQAHVKEALPIFKRLRMLAHEQRALLTLSTTLRLLRDRENAFQAARLSLSKSIVFDGGLEQAEAMVALGSAFLDLHSVAHAVYCARSAARMASACGDPELFVESRMQQFLAKAFQNPPASVHYGAETLEIIALMAPNYLDRALNIIANFGRDRILGWTIGSYLASLVAQYMQGSSLPFIHMAEIAIAHTLDGPSTLQLSIPGLQRLLMAELTPKEISLLRGVLALALQEGKPAESLRYIDDAVANADETGELPFSIGMRQIRIEINKSMARWESALADIKQIRPQLERLGSVEVAIACLEYEAQLCLWAGNIGGALEAVDSATIATMEQSHSQSHSRSGHQHLLRSRVLSAIGSGKAIIEAVAAQLPFFAAQDRIASAEQLICLSQAVLDLPEDHSILVNKTAEFLNQAREILDGKTGGISDKRLNCDLAYATGTFYAVHGDLPKADQTLQQADDFARTISYSEIRIPVLAARVRIALNDANLILARELADDLTAIARARRRPLEMIAAFHLAGRVHAARSEGEQARSLFAEAIGLYNSVRSSIESPILRKEWLRSHRAIFEHFANVLLDEGSYQEASNVIQQTKTASLDDLLRDAKIATGVGYGLDKGARIAALWRSIQTIEIEIERNAGIVGDEVSDYRRRVQLRSQREELDALRAPAVGLPHDRKPVGNSDELWRQLGMQGPAAIVEMFVTEAETVVFVGSAERSIEAVVRLTGLGRRNLLNRIQTTVGETSRIGNSNSAELESLLGDLHHALFHTAGKDGRTLDAVLKTLGTRRLILIPSGVLALLPLHALFSERAGQRRWLIDEFESFSYAPSMQLLLRSVASSARASGRELKMLAVQDPDGSLAHAEAEVRMIRSLFHTTSVLAREQATKDDVRQAYPHADIVHFACHGAFNNLSPYDSGLLLADGVLPLSEIYLNLNSSNTDLIVLSACETANVSEKFADEFLSISSGFIYAGARRVVSALWPVADNSTALLMRHFYEQLAAGIDGPIALTRAQRWLRDVTAGEIATLYSLERQTAESIGNAHYALISTVWRRFAAMDSDHRPFSGPAFWAGFTYIGM